MEINLTGKTALVTGAGKGIGRITAILLAECGANVIALSRTQSDLDSLKTESKTPSHIKTICVDLMNLDEAVKAIESLDDHIDLLVNNAAYTIHIENFLEVTEDEINKAVKVNLTAPLRLSQVVARNLIKRGLGGAIVNVSSVITSRFCGNTVPYGLPDFDCKLSVILPEVLPLVVEIGFSKAALEHLTKTLAVELAPHKIRVNTVVPGLTNTPIIQKYFEYENVQSVLKQTPRGVMAEPKEIAHTIVYLLSNFASNVTGSQVACDGGFLVG